MTFCVCCTGKGVVRAEDSVQREVKFVRNCEGREFIGGGVRVTVYKV